MISAAHGVLGGRGAGPEEVDDQGSRNLVRAAVDAGVEHVVLLSVLDARPDHPLALHRAKHAAEQHLDSSGLGWTVLRPSSYVETWIDLLGGRLASGRRALVFGRGENPVNFVSVQDVAALVERAVADPALRGQAIDVPGLDNLTMHQLAQHLGAHHVSHVPRAGLRLLAPALGSWAPAGARQARAALVMDTTDMAADASALVRRFPDVAWHRASEIAEQARSAREGARS